MVLEAVEIRAHQLTTTFAPERRQPSALEKRLPLLKPLATVGDRMIREITKVLVVEDEPLLLMMAIDIVVDLGFQPVAARNADEAVGLIANHSEIQILFTDIQMPGSIDGLALALIIRERWPLVEIIFVSGMRKPDVTEMPERSIFFSKPYDAREVSDALVRMAA